jgi:hypothetical protein
MLQNPTLSCYKNKRKDIFQSLFHIIFAKTPGGKPMKPSCIPSIPSAQHKLSTSDEAITSLESRSAYVYRVCLVKDHSVSFGENCNITNPSQAQAILKDLILTRGSRTASSLLLPCSTAKTI